MCKFLVYKDWCTKVGVQRSVCKGRCTKVGVQRLVYKGRCAKVGVKRLVYKGWCTKVDVRKAMSDILSSEGPSLERNVILRIAFLIFSVVFVVYLLVPPAHTINLPSIV